MVVIQQIKGPVICFEHIAEISMLLAILLQVITHLLCLFQIVFQSYNFHVVPPIYIDY